MALTMLPKPASTAAMLQILLHYGEIRNARESPVAASRSALRSLLHHSSDHYTARAAQQPRSSNARNSIGRCLAAVIPGNALGE
jgi:hypothetical protein